MKLLKNIILISCFLIGSLNNPAFADEQEDKSKSKHVGPLAEKTTAAEPCDVGCKGHWLSEHSDTSDDKVPVHILENER